MSIALVLAGGKSRRMGQDKAMIELAGKPLIAHSIERMRKQAQHVLIAANHDYQTGLPFIPDHDDGPQGPVAALWAARRYLDKAKLDSSGFVSVPVDSPFLPDDLIDRLAQTPNTARFASTPQHKHIACAYWPLARLRSALDSLESPATASPSLRQILTACDALSVHWTDETPFININTPEDLAYAKTCFTQNAAASKD